MFGNTSTGMTPDHAGLTNDIWIAIANGPNGDRVGGIPTLYDVSYYTCALRNSSVTTNIAFVDNIQSLQAKAIR